MTLTADPPLATGPPTWLLDPNIPSERKAFYLDAVGPVARSKVVAWMQAQLNWKRSPLSVGVHLDPTTVVTPALRLIDEAIVRTVNSPPPATGGHRGLIISMSPQEGKTLNVTQRGTEWLLVRDKKTRVGLVSYDQDNMRRVSRAVRGDIEYFNGTEGNADLGLRLRHGEKADTRWNLAAGPGIAGGVYAIGITGGFTGRPIDVLFIDDPVKDYRSADSALISEQTWVWWLSVGRPRLAPGAPVILVLTRWSDLDLAGRLQAEQERNVKGGLTYYDRWEVINIPAQADYDPAAGESDPLGREPGEWLESARGRTVENWEATKASTMSQTGSRVWSALYQGRPAPKEGGEIKRAWFRYTTEVPKRATEWVTSWDMKLKEKRTGDYVAGGVMCRIGSHYYLLDVYRGQWNFATVQNAIALAAVRYPYIHRHLIENTGNGPEVMVELRKPQPDYEVSDDVAGELKMSPEERAAVQELRRRGLEGLVAQNPKGDKAARIRTYTGIFESGNFHVLTSHWSAEYVEEMASFGVGGTHDDQVDMTSQALKRLARRGAPNKGDDAIKVPEGRVPPTVGPGRRSPTVRAVPPVTRQGRVVQRQLDRGK